MEFTFESSLSFVLKLLICQLFISIYVCRFSTRVPHWSQSSRKPGQTFSLKRADLGTSSTFEGNLVGAQSTWTIPLPGNREAEPCQRAVYWPWIQGQCPLRLPGDTTVSSQRESGMTYFQATPKARVWVGDQH